MYSLSVQAFKEIWHTAICEHFTIYESSRVFIIHCLVIFQRQIALERVRINFHRVRKIIEVKVGHKSVMTEISNFCHNARVFIGRYFVAIFAIKRNIYLYLMKTQVFNKKECMVTMSIYFTFDNDKGVRRNIMQLLYL